MTEYTAKLPASRIMFTSDKPFSQKAYARFAVFEELFKRHAPKNENSPPQPLHTTLDGYPCLITTVKELAIATQQTPGNVWEALKFLRPQMINWKVRRVSGIPKLHLFFRNNHFGTLTPKVQAHFKFEGAIIIEGGTIEAIINQGGEE